MAGKKITIGFLPEKGGRIRWFAIPRSLPVTLFVILAAALTALSLFSYYTYQELQAARCGADDIRSLRKTTAHQKVQIYAFADKVRLLERRMAKLRQFDDYLRAKSAKVISGKSKVPASIGGSYGASTGPKLTLKSKSADLIRRMHRQLDVMLAQASVLEVAQQHWGRTLEDSKSIVASSPTTWPLKGKLTSYFGYRSSPWGGKRQFHRGLDIQGPVGKPIVAPADGVVVSVDWNSGYGMILAVNHGYGVVTRYAHITQAFVEPGQPVYRGQKIAAVGATGRVTGPHLHYEVILNGIPVNPMRFLTAQK